MLNKESVEFQFATLSAQWERETALLSSTTEIVLHPAYQKIIDLGTEVIPYILRELQRQPNHWFRALRTLTGQNPVAPNQQGRMREMAAAWIQWGLENGYLP